MLKITIKSNVLQEGRSKQRWRQTASNAIADYLLKAIKANPERYMKRGIFPFSISEILNGIAPPEALKRLGELKLAVIVDPTMKQSAEYKGAAYMYEDPNRRSATVEFPRRMDLGDRTDIEPLNYDMSTGDITVKMVIRSAGISPELTMFHNKMSSNINHELTHLADDIEGNVARSELPPKELVKNNTQLVDRLNNSYLQPTEIRAYATQVIGDSRKSKTKFLDNLDKKASLLSQLYKKNNKTPEDHNLIDSVFKIWKFKIIDYVMNKYNIFNKRDANGKLDSESQAIRVARATLSKEVDKIVPSLFGGD
jgi:hypothetical protein